MTIYYVDTAGSNTSPYDTKAKAANSIQTILAIDNAGDTIYISSTHSETLTGAATLAVDGSRTSPSKLICINFGTDAISTGAIIGSTETLFVTGAVYAYGITFRSGVGSSVASHNITTNATNQKYEQCSFYVETTNSTGNVVAGNRAARSLSFINCYFKFAHVSHNIITDSGTTRIIGGGLVSGTSAITKIFDASGISSPLVDISGFDASLADASASVIGVTSNSQGGLIYLYNIKMPTSWTGTLTNGDLPSTSDIKIIGQNIGSVDANYYSASQSYAGKHINDTILYDSITDGANHNGSIIKQSYKVTLNAEAEYPNMLFYSLLYPFYNTVTTSQTATIEFIHNETADLTDADIWLELEYLNISGSSLSTLISDGPVSILATPTNQTTSTADWDNGLTARANSTAYSVGNIFSASTNPGRAFICTTAGTTAGSIPGGYATAVDGDSITDNTAVFKAMRRQKVDVTFTAAEQGLLIARVALAKANAVVWLSTKLAVA